MTAAMPMPFAKHLTSDLDLTPDSLRTVLDLAHEVKRTPARFSKTLTGRYLTLLFEKPSLRTRLTFELGMKQLGGDTVTSSSYKMTFTLGQPTQNQTTTTSSSYRMQGGLIGANGTLP